MKYQSKVKQHKLLSLKGFSLLELMLVIVIIIGITLAGYSRYRSYKRKEDIEIMKQNMALVLRKTVDCYYELIADAMQNPAKPNPLCREYISDIMNNVSCKLGEIRPQLIPTDLMPNIQTNGHINIYTIEPGIPVQPPKVNPCGVGAKYYNHKLQAYAWLISEVVENSLSWYEGMLGAESKGCGSSGPDRECNFIWTTMPTYTIEGVGSSLWIMGAGLGVFTKSQQSN